MASHSVTLFSVLMRPQPVRTNAEFAGRVLDQVANHVQERGYGILACRLRSDRDIHFAKALNRRVTGSINQLTGFATVFIGSPDEDLDAISDRLNATILSFLGKNKNDYGLPKDALEELLIKQS